MSSCYAGSYSGPLRPGSEVDIGMGTGYVGREGSLEGVFAFFCLFVTGQPKPHKC